MMQTEKMMIHNNKVLVAITSSFYKNFDIQKGAQIVLIF